MNAEQIKTMQAAHDYIRFDRDCFYDSITTTDGRIQSARDQFDLDAVDKLLDEIQTVLASVPRGQNP